MCDVFYFGGSVVDNWTAPQIVSTTTETKTSTSSSTTTTDVSDIANNAMSKIENIINKKETTK